MQLYHDQRSLTLLSLPPELIHTIAKYLPYPDHLALRHTHPLVYAVLKPSEAANIDLKIDWLLDRKARNLRCPLDLPFSSPKTRLKSHFFLYLLYILSLVGEKLNYQYALRKAATCRELVHGRGYLIEGLDLRTDEAFCRSGAGEVRRILDKRRRCGECGVECEIIRGRRCWAGLRRAQLIKERKKSRRSAFWCAALVVGLLALLPGVSAIQTLGLLWAVVAFPLGIWLGQYTADVS
ncbi:hypothetical protein MMC25_003922 [Agyrium rufum]|nr:hypothetical protein [Agyrium rufum]